MMNNSLGFIKQVKPFNTLPDEVLEKLPPVLEEFWHKKESVIYLQDFTKIRGLDIILEGGYEAFFYDSSRNKRMVEEYGPGTCYGGGSILLHNRRPVRTVIAKKGTLVLNLPYKEFKILCSTHESFLQYFVHEFGSRMLNDEYAHFVNQEQRVPEENYGSTDQFFSRRLEAIKAREVISCPPDTPIYRAAQMMEAHKVSCLFITNGDEKIEGYVTDISLRNNVLGRQVNVQLPVGEVMDNPIVSISRQAFIYEAILLMFSTKTRYLLIEEGEGYSGFISRNRLLSEQSQSPLMFIQSVKLAQTQAELKEKWEKVPEIISQLLNRGVKSEIVNQLVTSVSDTIALRVIEWVIDELGPPPAKFVFITLGSEGRKEQTLKTDQDNAIIYEDKANEQRELVRAYFLDFAERVSEKLNDIGFSFCEGGFMAKNPRWTHSLSHWKQNYTSWMSQASAETVMNFATFFDCRYIYGDVRLVDELREFLDLELQKPLLRFLFLMANNALQYEPPLTFFQNIRTFKVGEQKVFNIKKAMMPIVDLVRVYSLKNRIFKTNTGERLQALCEQGIFTEKEYQELMQAYYYLMGLRLKKQAMQVIADRKEPGNLIEMSSLTKIEEVTLREIFKVIRDFQQKIKMDFTDTLF